jgi:Integrase core domain
VAPVTNCEKSVDECWTTGIGGVQKVYHFTVIAHSSLEYIAMGRIYQPLLFLLARCTRNQLIRQIEFLKAENEMLRKRVPRRAIVLQPAERERLIKLGQAMGTCVKSFISIVTYETYLFWLRKLRNQAPRKQMGRPRTPEAIRELVLKIARENHWGYTRILGELRKLGYMNISRQTVVNILKAAGLDPDPRHRPGVWDDFLHKHAETLWQCDFFSKRILSRLGLPQVYAMVLINVATRKVWVSPCTKKPTGAWVKTQVDAFLLHAARTGMPVGLVSRDRDKLYRNNFDHILRVQGVDVNVLVHRSPNLHAYVERFIQSIQVECLDHFLVFGEKHFDYLVREYLEHYHTERPHQGLGNRLVSGVPPPPADGEVLCRTRLGGLLKHYYRAA